MVKSFYIDIDIYIWNIVETHISEHGIWVKAQPYRVDATSLTSESKREMNREACVFCMENMYIFFRYVLYVVVVRTTNKLLGGMLFIAPMNTEQRAQQCAHTVCKQINEHGWNARCGKAYAIRFDLMNMCFWFIFHTDFY